VYIFVKPRVRDTGITIVVCLSMSMAFIQVSGACFQFLLLCAKGGWLGAAKFLRMNLGKKCWYCGFEDDDAILEATVRNCVSQ